MASNRSKKKDFFSDEYLKFSSKLNLKVPSDEENILSSPQDCLEILEKIKSLAQIILGKEFNHETLFYIGDRFKWYQSSDNNITREKLLLEIKLKTLYLITKTAKIANEFLIKPQFTLEEFKELVKSTSKEADLVKVTAIELTDLSNILENISRIFPEIKIPEKHYEGRGLVSHLNPMVSGSPITSGCKGLRDKDIWDKDPVSGIAYYEYIKHDNLNSIITHYIRDWNSDEIKAIPFNEATQILDNFGSQTALLHLILAVHVYSKADPTSTHFRLKGTDLIHDLGLAKRSDLSTSQKLKIVLETVNAVRSLLIKAEWQGEKKQGKKIIPITVNVESSLMWDLSPKVDKQKNLFGEDDFLEIYIECQIGSWINHFFNEAGYKMGKALYNFATLAQNILELNPYHEELALRIALLQSTMPYRSYITVEHWLEENLLGYKDRISKARSDTRRRSELKKYWDKTLDALERIGFHIHFDEESYPQDLRPNGKVPRGYFESWLKAKIKITPQKISKPSSAIERQERFEREKPKKLTPTKTYSGSELKKARTANKLTQEMIAKYLQCSKGTISKLEKKSTIPLKRYKEIMDAINFVAKNPKKFK